MAMNSYVVTVRQPSKDGYTNKTRYFPGCDYLLANGGFNKTPSAYSAVAQPQFWKTLQQDLLAIRSQYGSANLIVLIHGFTITYDQCIAEAALYGQNIVNAGIPAIVVALSWPGDPPDFDIDGVELPLNYFAAHAQGRAVATSVLEFLDMLNVMRHGFGKGWLNTCAVCHSMGNYLLGQVTSAAMQRTTPFDRTPYFDRTLLVAADLANICLDKNGGTAFGINALAGQVTVYWSYLDDVLPLAVAALDDASQPNPWRLGLNGPGSYPMMSQQHVAVDCWRVVNEVSGEYYGVDSHSVYFYIPQVLTDFAQTLQGQATSDREPLPNTNGQGFVMKLELATRETCAGITEVKAPQVVQAV